MESGELSGRKTKKSTNKKYSVAKNPKGLAKLLGLDSSVVLEWEAKNSELEKKIVKDFEQGKYKEVKDKHKLFQAMAKEMKKIKK